ncbi:MAG: MBL fold metallo-hydrolase [Chloroflexales bacterium]|nr:MBL fold metallo-hydrolase [Chloroflexales bacterium]
MDLRVLSFTGGPFAENSYLLSDATGGALFIDPGYDGERLWRAARDADLRIAAILLTHAHLDHVGALTFIRQHSGAPVYLHPADDALLAQAHIQWQQFGLRIAPIAPAEHQLHHGDTLAFGALTLEVLHTPGHTPGGVCFYSGANRTLIAGDTLFRRSIGRTDLPGGDGPALLRSIRERIFPLDGAGPIAVYPGHGPPTTIREELEQNPFVGIPASSG